MENRNHFTMKSMNFFCVGMLIPGKMHPESRVAIPGCQSRLLNFTTVCTIYPYMIKVGSPAEARGRGATAGRSPTLFPDPINRLT